MLQGLEIIEVAIGLMLVFLVLSIIVTAINELIAHVWSLRANNLYEGIENLIGRHLTKHLYLHTSIAGTTSSKERAGFLRGKKARPSYIEDSLFVQTLFDLLVPADPVGKKLDVERLHHALANPASSAGLSRIVNREFGTDLSETEKAELEAEIKRLRIALNPILESAADIAGARTKVAEWYCQAMDRNSGQYKRRIQFITVGVAVVLALVLNLDSLALSERLFVDDELRKSVLEQAGVVQVTPVVGIAGDLAALDAMALPVGWPDEELDCVFTHFSNASPTPTPVVTTAVATVEIGAAAATPSSQGKKACAAPLTTRTDDVSFALVSKVLGLILSAAAISLGAPFWFDTLDKFMKIRSAGVTTGSSK